MVNSTSFTVILAFLTVGIFSVLSFLAGDFYRRAVGVLFIVLAFFLLSYMGNLEKFKSMPICFVVFLFSGLVLLFA